MAAYFNLVLDTTAPQGATFTVNSNAAYSSSTSVTGDFSTSDTPTTGYQVKVWGDIDAGGVTEGGASWVAYTTGLSITLATGDGLKTVYAKIRDDVGNETAQLSDTITLDTTMPVVTVGTPSVSKISKVAGFRTATCTFQADTVFDEYQVRVVPATGSIVSAGTLIPTTNGSINTSGSAGGYPATTNITVTIDGRDLETASGGAGNDGTKIVKVFVQDVADNWSI